MDLLIGLAIFVGVVSLIGLVSYYNYRKERLRKEKLGEVAEQLGLYFSPDGTEELLERLSGFQLFNLGHSRKMSNLIAGDTEEVAISIFDYKYTVGTGKQQSTHSMTVSAIKSPDLHCPEFSLRPENFFDKFGAMLGFQDINIEAYPRFSGMFVLQGPDENAIREFLKPGLVQFFEANPGISVIAEQGTLLFYWQGKRAKPDDLKDFFAKSYEVYGRIVETVPR